AIFLHDQLGPERLRAGPTTRKCGSTSTIEFDVTLTTHSCGGISSRGRPSGQRNGRGGGQTRHAPHKPHRLHGLPLPISSAQRSQSGLVGRTGPSQVFLDIREFESQLLGRSANGQHCRKTASLWPASGMPAQGRTEGTWLAPRRIRTKNIDDFNKQSDEFGDLICQCHCRHGKLRTVRQMVFLTEDENLEAVFTAMGVSWIGKKLGSKLNVSVSIEDASSGGSEEVQLSREVTVPRLLAEDGKLVIHMGEAASAEELKRSGRQQVRELLDSGELLLLDLCSKPKLRIEAEHPGTGHELVGRVLRDDQPVVGAVRRLHSRVHAVADQPEKVGIEPQRQGGHLARVHVSDSRRSGRRQSGGSRDVCGRSMSCRALSSSTEASGSVCRQITVSTVVEDEHRPAGLNASRTSYAVSRWESVAGICHCPSRQNFGHGFSARERGVLLFAHLA
uniref:SHSP domain-containing protein n=1 Tax=Macrostomum lignano TaxID=282301 RepID=A0A1I8FLD6_9PLAT